MYIHTHVDYKILAKALGNRINSFLPSLIDEDQTGYVKNRFIGNNILIIVDILMYTKLSKVPGILLAIDFEKAFDSLRWDFLDKCLQTFDLGQNFRSYINILYHEISAAVLNNGHISRWFAPLRGVRQGCPLSPYLFILAVETLSCAIRNSNVIPRYSGWWLWNKNNSISRWYHMFCQRQSLPPPPFINL